MILGDLLRCSAYDSDATFVGHVIDARLRATALEAGGCLPTEIYGLIIGPHSSTSFLGYERETTRAPWIVDRLMRWHHRGTFLVVWADVEMIVDQRVHLRPGYRRYRAVLPPDQRRRAGEMRTADS
ncbi:hypothetical protein BH683_018385 [Williamsia sp. 1138]|uniref:hypothetical protein n=1 Tax=Williamsia sp. 1138 TaxID=1903117 RepID=UPI000A10D031|nr:hypothetical protein [Williamsia sp. 1138]OZG27822.1 hypothetical protein BH683_018385 [Williamsia sp. 1138]